MTDSRLRINLTQDDVQAVGRLAIAQWALRHQLAEFGRHLGVDVEDGSASAGDLTVIQFLSRHGLPPWAAADADVELSRWLQSHSDWHHEVDQMLAIAAASRSGPTVRQRWLDSDNVEQSKTYDVHDFEALVAAAGELLADADEITSQLGLLNAGGGTTFGYRDIAHSLYKRAIDVSPSPSDSAPRPRES